MKIEELEPRVAPAYVYFPGVNPNPVPGETPETDGRFLSVTGDGASTIAYQPIDLEFAIPGPGSPFTSATLTIGVYDGDTGGLWDEGTQPLQYAIYADSKGDGTGAVQKLLVSGSSMGDQQWYNMVVNTGSEALSADGSYYMYTLRVTAPPTADYFSSNFKLRVNDNVYIAPRYFAFMACAPGLDEARITYPNFDQGDLTTTTYNGTWDFSFWVQNPTSSLAIWDGDFDYGSAAGSPGQTFDTNDPDCSGVVPSWAVPAYTTSQGAAVGLTGTTSNPNDDSEYDYYRRSPSVTYKVINSNGQQYVNNNPSGNQEWEKFWIVSNLDGSPGKENADYQVTGPLASGVYSLHVDGLDVGNLVAFHFEPMPPAPPLATIGDFVWHDSFQSVGHQVDGLQDGGEPPMAGIALQLYSTAGSLLTTTTTDSNGLYKFGGLLAGTYKVKIADSNFNSGGVLLGWYPTLANAGGSAVDSNGNLTTHDTTVTVAAGEYNSTVDFGFFRTGFNITKTGYVGPVEQVTPSDGTWLSPLGHWYNIYDPTDNPFYCIKFNPFTGTGINNGQIDQHIWSVSTDVYDPTVAMHVGVHNGGPGGGIYMDTYMLPVAGSTATLTGTLGGQTRSVVVTFTSVASDPLTQTTTFTVTIQDNFKWGLSYLAYGLPGSVNSQYAHWDFTVQNTGDLIQGANVYDLLLNASGDHKIWTSQVLPGQTLAFQRVYTPTQTGTITNTATATAVHTVPAGYTLSVSNLSGSANASVNITVVPNGTQPLQVAPLSGGSLTGASNLSISPDLLAAEVSTQSSTAQTTTVASPASAGTASLIAGPVVTSPSLRSVPVRSGITARPNTASYVRPSGFLVPDVSAPLVPLRVVTVPNLGAAGMTNAVAPVNVWVKPSWIL